MLQTERWIAERGSEGGAQKAKSNDCRLTSFRSACSPTRMYGTFHSSQETPEQRFEGEPRPRRSSLALPTRLDFLPLPNPRLESTASPSSWRPLYRMSKIILVDGPYPSILWTLAVSGGPAKL